MKTVADRESTETQAFIAELDKLPSTDDLIALCTKLHALMTDDPMMLWLHHSFEDQADSLIQAQECADAPQSPADESWPARQDVAVEAHERIPTGLREEFEASRHRLPDARDIEYWEKLEE